MPPKQMQNLARKNIVNEIAQRFENISANKTDQNASNSTLYNKQSKRFYYLFKFVSLSLYFLNSLCSHILYFESNANFSSFFRIFIFKNTK
jgi:hypothetical protein